MAIPVIIGSLAATLLHHAPSKSQQAYLDLALAGSVHDATAIAEFAANPSLSDWAGWEGAWETLISRNPGLAAQGYALARAKPQLNPSSGTYMSSPQTVTQTTSGPPAGGIADTLAGFLSKVTAPSANTAAAAAGTAAAKQSQGTLLTIGLLVAGALVVGALILRRR